MKNGCEEGMDFQMDHRLHLLRFNLMQCLRPEMGVMLPCGHTLLW